MAKNTPPTMEIDVGVEEEVLDDEDFCIHIRNQQRTGKKSLTTITGIPAAFDLKALLKTLKKSLNCNGKVEEKDEKFGNVIQLQGDHRAAVAEFLYNEGIAEKERIRSHLC